MGASGVQMSLPAVEELHRQDRMPAVLGQKDDEGSNGKIISEKHCE